MRRIMTGVLVLLLAAGCSDPLRNVDKLSDVPLAEDAASVDALPGAVESSAEGGFLTAQADSPTPIPAEPKPKGGLLGFFAGKAAKAKSSPSAGDALEGSVGDDTALSVPSEDAVQETQVAALSPSGGSDRKSGGGGLFGFLGGGGAKTPDPNAPDNRQVGPGVTLPFGEIARICALPERALGTLVERYPERGRGYALYDSKPGNNAAHNWYLTGFDDGCARQFTAALAMFGAPEMHEQLRYGLPSASVPYSPTDTAYEQVKSRVCGARTGQPCGRKIGALSKDTAFVSVYERFGGSSGWNDLLLHDGDVVASDLN
ncbi:hypothetical protein [Puniceibacterium sp. IMCC21224]|uniref:hypothetical protein n=1 Tax=Puniceibacterium sp. IMCC21224 TaxID=1618204 RepID=UPI00065DB589|nr:hypothetical protein [Puniceibacterium sp. IMCC21224]KMK66104.1 hypothetical protein IMCC21224_11951 [Puniceibacterium sp. IMCC21224]